MLSIRSPRWRNLIQRSALVNLYSRSRFTHPHRNFCRTPGVPDAMNDAPASLNNPTLAQKDQSGYFQYEPLDTQKNEVRLLRIKPSTASIIQCEIFHVSLNEAPHYNALSYAWGDKSVSHPIRINSGYVNVSTNLKHLLFRLKPDVHAEELIVWVDAICINQQDISERNNQIENMRSIYSNATRVLVWLGLGNNHSNAAFLLAYDLVAATKQEAIKIIQDSSRWTAVEALVILFRRQYWWRVWVIQEISCARETVVYCGGDSISWVTLEKLVEIMNEQEDHLVPIYYKHLSKVRTLTHGGPRSLQLSRFSPSSTTPPLMELLVTHKSKKSTDPRDKVYALVGISESRFTFGSFDYSLSMREIYTHTSRHIIETSQKLDVICVKQRDSRQFDLPTWVTDWTRPPSTSPQTLIGLHHHTPPFSAAGDTTAIVSFEDEGYVLKTEGVTIDCVVAGGIPFKRFGAPNNVVPALQAIQNWRQVFFDIVPETTKAGVEFCKTISAGNWMFENDKEYEDKLRLMLDLSGKESLHQAVPESISRMNSFARTDSGLSSVGSETSDGGPTDEEKEQMATVLSVSLTMNRRKFLISAKNRAALGPWNAQIGDFICVLLGCRFPVVLRPMNDHFTLVGEVYMDGIMNGEVMTGLQEGHFVVETFEIH